MPLPPNTRLGRYEIRTQLGAGGMGEVYLAEDAELERQVALKVLLSEVAGDEDRVRRFVQEAKAASALNHPNILTVYEIGNFQDSRFIATELIKGETLRERLRGEPLSLRETLDVAAQLAAALNAAHSAGIVHRDVKPENVMLRDDGLAKVLDFGLAKLSGPSAEAAGSEVDAEAATRVRVKTSPGVVMGTVAYMSPEQARGREVDARSDIWSLAVVVYEMLTGRTPFADETANDTIAAILTREPAPLDGKTPPELQRILRKALRKNRDERYQTVKDFLLDLKNLKHELEFAEELERSPAPNSPKASNVGAGQTDGHATAVLPAAVSTQPGLPQPTSSAEYIVRGITKHKRGAALGSIVLLALAAFGYWYLFPRAPGVKQIESIAVMPFVNGSGDADAEYLSDGMTETLINSLSQLPNLNVKARSTVFRYKGKETTPQTIGKELNVRAVLHGRVTQRGGQLILHLELIDALTENVVWSEQYNRRQADLVTLQSEIARDVSGKLKLKLSGADAQKVAKTYTTDPEAYRLYLQGRFHWNKREEREFLRAVGYFNQAIALDPNYAPAYVGLADSYGLLSSFGFLPPTEAIPKARDFARRASSLDDSLAEPHATLGYVLGLYDHDFAGAERELQRAIELNPNYAMAHQWYGELLSYVGRFDEAAAEYRRGLELEPLSLPTNWEYGRFLYKARRFDEALAQLNRTVELDPNFARAHRTLSEVYWVRGDYANAAEERAKFFDLVGQPQNGALIRATFAREGWPGFLRLLVAENSPLKDTNNNWTFAKVYAALGEKDKAFAELNRAYESRSSSVLWFKVEPQLDPLRDDPRYQELLKRVGFPQ